MSTSAISPMRRPFLFFVALSLVFAIAFTAWSCAVFMGSSITAFDRQVAEHFTTSANPNLRPLMVAATNCGGVRANALIAAAGALWMWSRHRRRFAFAWLLIALIGGMLVLGLKEAFDRDRPPAEWRDASVHQENESYPSGHSAGGLIGYGMLGFVLLQRTKKWPMRVLIVLLLTSWVGLIGFSRVYLRAHWVSDVIGGWLLGMTYVNACLAIYFYRFAGAESASPQRNPV